MKDSTVKADVERPKIWRINRQRSKTSTTTTTDPPATPQNLKNFAPKWHHSDPSAVLNENEFDIANSWVLDSGSNINVCNDPSRFEITHTTTIQNYLMSGLTSYPITAYGTVKNTITSPKGTKERVKLNGVALIPGSLTNLVSFSKAKAARIYWDTVAI